MEKTIKRQTNSGFTYTAFEFPDILTEKDIGKSVVIAGNDNIYTLYKIHPPNTIGFKNGGVECVQGTNGIAKHCFLLDQVKFYNSENISKIKKIVK